MWKLWTINIVIWSDIKNKLINRIESKETNYEVSIWASLLLYYSKYDFDLLSLRWLLHSARRLFWWKK